jgi:hypothetical protein
MIGGRTGGGEGGWGGGGEASAAAAESFPFPNSPARASCKASSFPTPLLNSRDKPGLSAPPLIPLRQEIRAPREILPCTQTQRRSARATRKVVSDRPGRPLRHARAPHDPRFCPCPPRRQCVDTYVDPNERRARRRTLCTARARAAPRSTNILKAEGGPPSSLLPRARNTRAAPANGTLSAAVGRGPTVQPQRARARAETTSWRRDQKDDQAGLRGLATASAAAVGAGGGGGGATTRSSSSPCCW